MCLFVRDVMDLDPVWLLSAVVAYYEPEEPKDVLNSQLNWEV